MMCVCGCRRWRRASRFMKLPDPAERVAARTLPPELVAANSVRGLTRGTGLRWPRCFRTPRCRRMPPRRSTSSSPRSLRRSHCPSASTGRTRSGDAAGGRDATSLRLVDQSPGATICRRRRPIAASIRFGACVDCCWPTQLCAPSRCRGPRDGGHAAAAARGHGYSAAVPVTPQFRRARRTARSCSSGAWSGSGGGRSHPGRGCFLSRLRRRADDSSSVRISATAAARRRGELPLTIHAPLGCGAPA